MEHYKVFDYVNNVISLADSPEDFEKCNFAILCERYPIQVNRNNYLAKVIYISIKSDKSAWRLYPDMIKKYNIEYITLSTNSRRRLSDKMNEFFVNGNNQELTYEEHCYYNYSIEKTSKQTKELITKLREKYNIEAPELFIGVHQELVLE